MRCLVLIVCILAYSPIDASGTLTSESEISPQACWVLNVKVHLMGYQGSVPSYTFSVKESDQPCSAEGFCF